MKLDPFYFFADLINYAEGDKARRTIVAKIKAESQWMAQHNLLQLYKFMYRCKTESAYNIIPATEDDWLCFQEFLTGQPRVVNPRKDPPPPIPRKDMATDITGLPFGLLTAVRQSDPIWATPDKYGRRRKIDMWLFDCACGTKEKLIRRNNVTGGATTSCGCERSRISRENAAKTRSKAEA